MPIRKIEEICIFGGSKYFPQIQRKVVQTVLLIMGVNKRDYSGGSTTRYPTNILEFKCVDNYSRLHSSQKPIELCEYLIKTYTKENELVLDNCIGSGTTGVACKKI